MTQRIKGIVFDLGNTLLDFGNVDINKEFEAGARQAYDYLVGLGQPMPPFKTYHRQQFFHVRLRYFLSHITGRDFNARKLIAYLSERMGHNLTEEQLAELVWLWYEPVSLCATTESGLREMLEQFRDDGLKLGLLSNTFIPPVILDRHLERANLIDLLPMRVYSCTQDRRKPHPNIFEQAMSGIGLKAEELIFVGDSLRADIRGANGVGMVSVHKDPTGRKRHWRIKPDHRIRRIVDLADIVKLYNASAAN
ncbi:MAG: HAD family hydrolase [Planctomycetota bacterium]|jgi:FMN phosphatase YigB (HAD superfamily)